MENAVGQKGIVHKLPPDAVEVHVGMDLVVKGEVADMWLVERSDGAETYIPKDCFTLLRDASVRDHLDDLMSKVDEVIRVASYQEKAQMADLLQTIKERINDLTMEDDD